MRFIIFLLILTISFFLLKCDDRIIFTYSGSESISKDADVFRCDSRKSDILFVIDNSGSMAQEQENLAKNLDKFINGMINAQELFPYWRYHYRCGLSSSKRMCWRGM